MDLTFPLVVAIVVVLALWAGNYAGVEMTMRFAYVTGGLLLIPLVVFVVLPYVSGDWSASNLSWNLDGAGGGWLQNALVWLYIMAWTSFGVEVCATFTPEYRDGARDAWKALPIMNTGMADGSRALYGMSAEGVTIRQVGLLNRRGVPGRALALALVVNIAVLIFVSNPLAIIVTGNLGYLVAHFFALTGFILLRRDKPSLAPDPLAKRLHPDRGGVRGVPGGRHRRRRDQLQHHRLRRHEGAADRARPARLVRGPLCLPAKGAGRRPPVAARAGARGDGRSHGSLIAALDFKPT